MNFMARTKRNPIYFPPLQLALFSVLLFGSLARGQQTESIDDSPIRGALSTTPWFDAEQNSLKPIAVEPQTDDSLNRDSRWLPKPPKLKKNTGPTPLAAAPPNTGTPAAPGTGLFNTGLSALNLLGWLTLGIVVLVGVAAIFQILSRAELNTQKVGKGGSSALSGKAPDEQTLERMKHLPKELRRTDVNLRSEAQRMMQDAQYDQAIILLFAHQLLLLDRYGVLRLNRGKTNRKYIRETRASNQRIAECLEATITSFERSYFGRHNITRNEFMETWRLNEQLETKLNDKQEEAA